MQEEPVSEDLKEAASRYSKEEYNRKSQASLPDRCRGCYAPLMYAFKAGAKWKEQQIMKDAVYGTMGFVSIHLKKPNFGEKFKEGDKVKVLVIKED